MTTYRVHAYHALSYHWVLVSGDDACIRHLHDILVSLYKRTGFGVYWLEVLVGVYKRVGVGVCLACSFSGCVQAVLSGVTVFVKENTVKFLFVTD